uniref:HDC15744 n=1 Tax=Drosophila melanogaster TaxID=7227 RepID=Q6IJ75_DROME|nr:TPA_inf: HDC15744 [Drosophila melanogaster]
MPSKFVTQLDTRRRDECKTSQNGHRKWATLLHVLVVVGVAVVGVVNRNRITCQLPHTKLPSDTTDITDNYLQAANSVQRGTFARALCSCLSVIVIGILNKSTSRPDTGASGVAEVTGDAVASEGAASVHPLVI